MTDPRGNSVTYSYDVEGQLVDTTDRDSRRVTYSYDLRGRQTGETWVAASPAETITSIYDADGEMTSQSDANALLTFTYDAKGRQLTALTSGTAGQPAVTLTSTYANNGTQTSLSDNLGTAGVISYAYDSAHRLTTLTLELIAKN